MSAAAAPKRYFHGTHRTCAPEETLARLRPLLPAMGITRIANITGLDRTGIPAVMVCRPNSRSIAVSQGKGLTLEAAKASGVMEAVEVWHAERIMQPLRLASFEEMQHAHRVFNHGAVVGQHARISLVEINTRKYAVVVDCHIVHIERLLAFS